MSMNASPLLQNNLVSKNIFNKNQDMVYEDLQKRANEFKPNEAKAKIVRQNPLSATASAVTDTIKDCANFTKAVTTGKMNDHNLGRINDVGTKAGALLIATYLASHAKTKTDALMQFIGAGTFFASMSLWPKFFINLPARLVHGFRIDRKYISAQGDKKDFGLDNQFYVWDAYPEKQLRKDARRAGIDYDSENGKEKIQRKIQKTTLQNRTLWMATAGWSTPLMTALACNFIEPKVKSQVIQKGFENAREIITNDKTYFDYLNNAKDDLTSTKMLQALVKDKNNAVLDDDFFKSLSKVFDLSEVANRYNAKDDSIAIRGVKQEGVVEALKNLHETKAIILNSDSELTELIANLQIPQRRFTFSKGQVANVGMQRASAIVTQFKSRMQNPDELRKILKEQLNLNVEQQNEILSKLKFDNSGFFEVLKKFDNEVLTKTKGRLRAYLDLLNPIVGSRAESVFTREYQNTVSRLTNEIISSQNPQKGLKGWLKEFEILQSIKKEKDTFVENMLLQYFSGDEMKSLPKEQYIAKLKTIIDTFSEDVQSAVRSLENEDKIKAILPVNVSDEFKELNQAILGKQNQPSGLIQQLKQFISTRKIDVDALKARIIAIANFERRAHGDNCEFYQKLVEKNLIEAGDRKAFERYLEAARSILYNNSAAKMSNGAGLHTSEFLRPQEWKKLSDTLFYDGYFNDEESIVPGIKNIMNKIRPIAFDEIDGIAKRPGDIIVTKDQYLMADSLTQSVKRFSTSLANNKTWLKIFGTMGVALVGITLLAQPLFGNIKQEYPDKKEGGNK